MVARQSAISVGRLAPIGQWDQTLIQDLMTNRLHPTGLDFEWHEGYPGRAAGCILILPSRYWAGHEAEISMAVSKYEWVLFMLTSDEEQLLEASKIVHPNARFWIQTPRKGKQYPKDSRFIGVGYTPQTRTMPVEAPEKLLDVFLSCQRTHIRREEAFQALEHIPHSRIEATQGFTQGMDPAEYVRCMTAAKAAPTPSGAVSPDSFRVYEALEAHAVPVLDAVSPVDGPTQYWEALFPGYLPFPVYQDAAELKPLITQTLSDWPAIANRVAAWWMQTKRRYAHWLREDLEALGAL